jgi:molybdate transport system substrate-binding protein
MRHLIAALLMLLSFAAPARAQELTVFAAASLTDALRDIAIVWQGRGGAKLRFSFASSAMLARQLDQGAPANLFASADLAWMDWAQSRNLIVPETRRTLLGNRLVLVVPRDKQRAIAIGSDFDLAAVLGPGGRLAMGDPDSVSAGIYGRQALTTLGLWAAAVPRLAKAPNVRAALLLVERGEAPAGIVYATDAAATPGVAVAGTFPADTHDPIVYPFAVPKSGDTPAARALLDFLAGPESVAIFRRYGFPAAPGG